MRLIDADALFDEAFKAWGTEADASETNLFMEMINNAPTIAPPSNAPLTLEQLREMDGEPVWVEMFVKGLKSHWAIVHGEYLTDGRFVEDKQRCLLSIDENGGYGLAFLARRRKTEEGTTWRSM